MIQARQGIGFYLSRSNQNALYRLCCPVNCVYSWSPVRVHGIHIKGVVKNAKPNVLLPKGALLFQSRKQEAVSLQNSSFSSVFFRFFQFPEKFRKRDLFF